MKRALLLAALLSACASREARLERSEPFRSYPPELQAKIRERRVEPGFTEEMVRLALGAPQRRYKRETAGETLDVWGYLQEKPRSGLGYGIGLGVGSGRGVSGGISIGTPSQELVETVRVFFKDGVVVQVEAPEPE